MPWYTKKIHCGSAQVKKLSGRVIYTKPPRTFQDYLSKSVRYRADWRKADTGRGRKSQLFDACATVRGGSNAQVTFPTRVF